MPEKLPIPVVRLELVNSLIHGMGILFGIIAMPVLAVVAYKDNNIVALSAAAIYGFSFLMVFTFSTLYHGFQNPVVKETMRLLDHISIYFLIAGTYTPLVLCYFYNSKGLLMLKVLWGLAFLGIFSRAFYTEKLRLLSIAVYFAMGWILLWAGGAFFAAMPWQVVRLILAGNFLYTAGVIFYLWKRWAYHHAYWHLLVLIASICHYASIFISLKNPMPGLPVNW